MKSFRLITASSDEIFHSTTITLADRQNHKTLGIQLLVCGSCIMPPDIEHSEMQDILAALVHSIILRGQLGLSLVRRKDFPFAPLL